jgi:hypothetical protein
MGDIADEMISRFWGMEWSYRDRRTVCNRCGAYPLSWKNEKGRWILVDDHVKKHFCGLSAETEFEDLT